MASILFRASPIDPALRPPSPSASQSHDLSNYNHSSTSIDSQSVSHRPVTDAATGASSTSSQFSGAFPDVGSIDKPIHSPGPNSNGFESSSLGPSLPGLSALASVASAPTSNLRYVLLNNIVGGSDIQGSIWQVSLPNTIAIVLFVVRI